MKILLVNDDGYDAIGLQKLYEVLSKKHEVVVVAPSTERSGTGHGVTLFKPVKVTKKPYGYAIDGTPADCVKVGINGVVTDCDLVVSGINPGANLGVDTNYSGTASAAREAAIQGRQALAVSCYCREFKDVEYLAEYAAIVAQYLYENPLPKGTFLNLNLPNASRGETFELDTAPLGWFNYKEKYDLVPGEGPDEYVFTPYFGEKTAQEGHFDVNLVSNGCATLTPVSWNATHYESFHIAQEIVDRMKDEPN